MPSWGTTDDAANSVFYAPTAVNLTPNSVNQALLFNNATSGVWYNGTTQLAMAMGQFGISTGEMQAQRAGAGPKPQHAGWNLRKVGTGGRAGRVQFETLVALHTIPTGDADSAIIPNYFLSLTAPVSNSSFIGSKTGTGSPQSTTLTVVANSVPTGAGFAYQWQQSNSTGGFSSVTANSTFVNPTTTVLTINVATIATSNVVTLRCAVSNSVAATAFSSPVNITTIA